MRPRARARCAFALSAIALAFAAATASAGPKAPGPPRPDAQQPGPRLVDRVVVRWHAPETGGIAKPQFVFERELAFEAELEALADPDPETASYRERHVRAALDRHIAETLLASLAIVPAPTDKDLVTRAAQARAILDQRVHGREHVEEAAAREGIGADEIDLILARQARASLYLDRMVAPMLEPSEVELRELWKAGSTPFKELRYDDARPLIVRWLTGQRIARAIDAYYQNARSRVVLAIARKAP
jgi:hypothetical protein